MKDDGIHHPFELEIELFMINKRKQIYTDPFDQTVLYGYHDGEMNE